MAEVRKNTVHPLHIEGYTAEGMGVARLDGRVVFIPGTIRGEDWEVQLLKVNKGVAWGKGTRLISPSPVRQEPDCPYSGRCGGCQYRHMSYEEELAAKEPSVIISRRPCALLKYVKHKAPLKVNTDKCIGCKSCMKIGCPAISIREGKAHVDNTLCVGCGVCEQLCPVSAFESTGKEG